MNCSEMDRSKLVTYQKFGPYSNLIAFSTTKSTFPGVTNLRFTGGQPELAKENREQLAHVLKIDASQLVFPGQTHTNCVVNLNHIPENEISETDALLTNQPGICLCVQTADCVPVLLFDPVSRVIAAVHAGWRGTVTEIATLTVENIEISGECTFKENEKYYSARRDGIETGRIVSGIMLC